MPTFNPKVYFILINYNGDSDTIECINSINGTITYDNYGIIVVDNSPTGRSFEKLQNADFNNTVLLRSEINDGFAAGCNLGIKQAERMGYDYVILLNNDTLIKSPDLIERLLECFDRYDKVGIAGGKIFYYDLPDKVWYAAGFLSPVRLRAINRPGARGIMETPFITGCLQMISHKAIETVGLLPEEYFMCYEDADYCDMMHKAGYKTVYNADAQIIHKISKSAPSYSPTSIYNSNRARYIYIKKVRKGNIINLADFYVELYIKLLLYKGEKRKAIQRVLEFCRKK